MADWNIIAPLFTNINVLGMGMFFGVVSVIVALARNMTKYDEHITLLASSLAMFTAIFIIPNILGGFFVFLLGIVGIIITYMPLLKEVGEMDAVKIAVIGVILNFTILIMFSIYDANIGTADRTTISNTIDEKLDFGSDWLESKNIDTGLCNPNDTDCQDQITGGAYDFSIFDVFAAILNIPLYIAKLIQIIGWGLFGTTIISFRLLGVIENPIITIFLFTLMNVWQIAVLYNLAKFVLGKRGLADS